MTEIETLSQKLPSASLSDLAQEVVKRVASNLRPILPYDFSPTAQQIDTFCEALLSDDPAAAVSLIETLQRGGAGYETLCQSYLAVAARQLGVWWTDDRVSFYQVTIAAGRVYAILRSLRMQRPLPPVDLHRTAIFAGVPGDQHTLGITIAADLAREQGWDVELLTGLSHDELIAEIGRRETPLIGLSAGTKRALPALLKIIVALRVTKPAARIMLCGKITDFDLDLDGILGVDAVAADFDAAFAYMEQIAARGG